MRNASENGLQISYLFLNESEEEVNIIFADEEDESWFYDDGIIIRQITIDSPEVVIPDYIDGVPVKALGPDLFEGNEIIEHITLPKYLEEIGEFAFYNCKNLKSVSFPENLKKIEREAFNNCESLTSIDLSTQKVKILNHAFRNCSNLSDIKLSNKVEVIGCCAFNNTAFFKRQENWKNGVLYYENYLLYSRDTDEEYEIPEGTTLIARSAFSYNKTVKRIILPNSLRSIGYCAFGINPDVVICSRPKYFPDADCIF